MSRPAGLTALVILLITFSIAVGPVYSFEVDATGTVTRIVDGDTFHTSQDTIRLADVNTPEKNEPGYSEAKSALSEMVLGKEVLLDIDDVHRVDRYGTRLVCVVYVRHNATHLANVNKLLLEGGYAVVDDYPNEFSPNSWTSYVYSPEGSPSSPQPGPVPDLTAVIMILVVMVLVIAVVAIIFRSRGRRAVR